MTAYRINSDHHKNLKLVTLNAYEKLIVANGQDWSGTNLDQAGGTPEASLFRIFLLNANRCEFDHDQDYRKMEKIMSLDSAYC